MSCLRKNKINADAYRAVVVGSKDDIKPIKKEMGINVIHRKTHQDCNGFKLRKDQNREHHI
jgi:hypothetical protein